MDIASLTTAVLTVLAPWAAKGAEGFIEEAGKDAYEKARGLFEMLKNRWSGDKEAVDALEHFREKPQRYQKVLEEILPEKLEQDEILRVELLQLVEALGPTLRVIQEMDEAKRVTGVDVDEFKEGDLDVAQKFKKGEDVTGARIKRLG